MKITVLTQHPVRTAGHTLTHDTLHDTHVPQTLTPKRILSRFLDNATSRRDARQLPVGQDCSA
eukprot:scaffold20990_cov73-Phaeocystis_antarctica.AAC.2